MKKAIGAHHPVRPLLFSVKRSPVADSDVAGRRVSRTRVCASVLPCSRASSKTSSRVAPGRNTAPANQMRADRRAPPWRLLRHTCVPVVAKPSRLSREDVARSRISRAVTRSAPCPCATGKRLVGEPGAVPRVPLVGERSSGRRSAVELRVVAGEEVHLLRADDRLQSGDEQLSFPRSVAGSRGSMRAFRSDLEELLDVERVPPSEELVEVKQLVIQKHQRRLERVREVGDARDVREPKILSSPKVESRSVWGATRGGWYPGRYHSCTGSPSPASPSRTTSPGYAPGSDPTRSDPLW
jgi:hypothetical protein